MGNINLTMEQWLLGGKYEVKLCVMEEMDGNGQPNTSIFRNRINLSN